MSRLELTLERFNSHPLGLMKEAKFDQDGEDSWESKE